MYEELEWSHSKEFREYIEQNFKRYLDNIFLIWNPDHGEINDFHLMLNSVHPNIQ
jgi:hypothetical protein